ncbi:MAG: hypothetical protein DMF61_00395 [Blastocatellia bacterium AA13]|nr:MAG: hypothetical protein DMF61_00395 [Blastocatellia bacterium AA13]
MNKKLIIGASGLILGFAAGFFYTKSLNESGAGQVGAAGVKAAGPNAAEGGNPQAMMANVKETIERAKNNPNDFNAQVDAARIYNQVGRVPETIEYLKKAYDLNKTEAGKQGITSYVGQYYADQKNYDEAEKWYQRSLEANPDDRDVKIELAATFIDREPPQADRAIQNLQAVLKSNPKDAHALTHMVQAYLLKKDARSAEDTLARLKEAEPGNNMISKLQTEVESLKAGRPVAIPKE